MKKIFFLFSFCFLLVQVSWAREWESIKSGQFIVYYRNSVPEDFYLAVVEAGELEFRRVSENLGLMRSRELFNDKPISLYIYSDVEDYQKNAEQAVWSHGAALVDSRAIKTFPSDQGFFDALLPHELGHMILHEYLGEGVILPLWFEEGVAMYQEKARRISSQKFLQEALKNGQIIPFKRITNMRLYHDTDRPTVDLFYAQSASMVNFLINQLGERRFVNFCADLKDKMNFNEAFDHNYDNIENEERFYQKWLKFIKEGS